MRLPRLSCLFPRNDVGLLHDKAFLRRGNLFVSQFQFMRLPRLSCLFPRNDGGLRHCETFLRRGNLFVSSFTS
jgi:hypothetical protein